MDISIIDIILTTILISIPEQFIMVLMVLILLKEYDYLYSENIKESFTKIMMFIIVPYVLFTVTTFYLDINVWLRVFMNSIMQAVLVYFVVGYFGKKDTVKEHILDIIRVYTCSVISFIILIFLEESILVLPQWVFKYEILELSKVPLTNFILAIPNLIIMTFIVYINYVNINVPKSVIFNMVWEGKKYFKKIIFFQTIITISLYGIIYDILIRSNILLSLNQDVRIFIVFLIFTIMIIGNLTPWFIVYTLKLKQGRSLRKDLL